MSRVLSRDMALWLAVFLAYPLAGALGRLVANPADGLVFAFLTAAVAGATLGAAQWLGLGRDASPLLWIGATAIGLGVSFAIAQAVGATTSAAAPAIGAITGVGVGTAQSFVRSDPVPRPIIWIPTMGVAWAVAWIVTTSIGVQAEAGWPVVGVSGALTAQVLTGVVIAMFARRRPQPAFA